MCIADLFNVFPNGFLFIIMDLFSEIICGSKEEMMYFIRKSQYCPVYQQLSAMILASPGDRVLLTRFSSIIGP